LRNNRETGKLVRQKMSQLGKQKNQEFRKMFSRRELRWILENPAELLLSVRTPNIAESVTAFVLTQRYSGLRLVNVVTLRTDAVREDG
jgi:hypothetical protein